MKKLYFLFLSIGLSVILQAQTWEDKLPQDKVKNGTLTLKDYQKAFNDYWAPYDVDNGYYYDNGKKVKAPGWKRFMRWEWKKEFEVDMEGHFPETTVVNEMEKYYDKYPAALKSISGNWSNIGYNTTPGGYQGIGRVNCIAFHPADNNTFWIGSPSGGLWKTTDGGNTWTVLTDNNPVLGVSAIAVTSDYATSNTIYIATGDKDGGSSHTMNGGNSHDNESIGILKSTDGGNTWVNVLPFNPADKIGVYDLLIDPTDNNRLYASTDDGLYKTNDAGANWTKFSSNNGRDMEFKPGDPSTLYVIYSNQKYFMKFTNYGSSISYLSFPGSSSRRTDIAVSNDDPSVVYAVTVNSDRGLEAVYKSTDSGASFSMILDGSVSGNNILGYECNGTTTRGQGTYDLFIAVNPSDADEVFIGGINVWKSTDGGSSWSIKTHWSTTCSGNCQTVHADQHACEYHPGTGDVFIGNDGGIYKSTDGGNSWINITNGLTINQIYRVGNSAVSADEIIVGLQDNGTHLYSGGAWWQSGVLGGDGMQCLIDPTDDDVQFGEYPRGNIRRTANHWNSTIDVRDNVRNAAGDPNLEGTWLTPYMLDPNNSNVLYIGYEQLWKSTDQGTTSTNFTQLTNFTSGDLIKSVAIAPSNSNYIYLSHNYVLWKSTDGGVSWTDITAGLPVSNGKITNIAVKNDDPNTVWITLGGFNTDAIYESSNGGTTWSNISAGLPAIPAMAVVQNTMNTSEVELYLAMYQGVYLKKGTAAWVPFSSGLPNVFCTDLEIFYDSNDPCNSKLRVATFGRGLWESDLYYDPSPFTWTGNVDSDWNTPGNWAGGTVPGRCNDVVIPSSALSWPVINGDFSVGVNCKSINMTSGYTKITFHGDLMIENGKSFYVDPAGNGDIEIDGDFTVNGSFSPGLSTVYVGGTSNSVLSTPLSSAELINDDFSNYPAGWNGDIGTTGGLFGQNVSNNAGGSSPEVMFTYLNLDPGERRIFHDPVNTSGITNMVLQFKHMVDDYNGSADYTLHVQYSTDGNSWSDVWTLSPSANVSAATVSIPLSSSDGIGSPAYYIAFAITGNLFSIDYWYIDDVVLSYDFSGTIAFNNLLIRKSGAVVSTNSNITVQNDFTLQPAAQFTNNTGNTFTVNGIATFGADNSGVASFIDNGLSYFANPQNVDSYLSQDKWHIVSAPVSDAVSGVFLGIYLKYFTEPNYSWHYITDVNYDLTEGEGFFAWSSSSSTGNTIVTYSGNLNNGDLTLSNLSYTASQPVANRGWNLIGNPYPSYINWNSNWSKTNVDATAYIYDGTQYVTWNGTTGTHPNGDIAPGQGFWVKANATGASLTIPQSERKHSSQAFYKSGDKYDELFITVEGNGYTDKMIIKFDKNSTSGFDSNFDAWKLKGDVNAPQLYSIFGEDGLTVNTLPFEDESVVIPVGFEAGANTSYVIGFNDFELENSVNVWLEDIKTSEVMQVTQDFEYQFEASVTDDKHRFNLHFGNLTVIDENQENNINIYSFGSNIYISSNEVIDATLSLFDITGRKMLCVELSGKEFYSIPVKLNTGIYIVKLNNSKNSLSGKIYIKH